MTCRVFYYWQFTVAPKYPVSYATHDWEAGESTKHAITNIVLDYQASFMVTCDLWLCLLIFVPSTGVWQCIYDQPGYSRWFSLFGALAVDHLFFWLKSFIFVCLITFMLEKCKNRLTNWKYFCFFFFFYFTWQMECKVIKYAINVQFKNFMVHTVPFEGACTL